jgi:Tfp pilus assembly protein PilN
MKIYLDLLPDERKQEMRRKKVFRGILRDQFLFSIPMIVFILILCDIYYVLTEQKKYSLIQAQTVDEVQEQYNQLNTYEDKFKEVYALGQIMIKIQSKHLHWQQFFRELSNVVPDGVYLTNFSTKDYVVFLVGKAKVRDDLLTFKEKLESSPCFESVNVPLSDLVDKENIDFQIDLKVKESCLLKQ